MSATVYPVVLGPCVARLRAAAAGPLNDEADLIERGRWQEAADRLSARLGSGDPGAEAALGLGLILYFAGDPAQAYPFACDAIQRGIGSAGWLLRAACELRHDDPDAATASLRTALGEAPHLHAAHALMWVALDTAGRLSETIAALRHHLAGHVPEAPAGERVDIEHTTLAIVDCIDPLLGARAMRTTLDACRFEHAMYLSDDPPHLPGVERVRIPRIDSAAAYSAFMLRRLADYVATDHVLVIQWDGHAIDPGAWTPEFLLHDYIGAPFEVHEGTDPRHRVGNGGFSLRSRALLKALREADLEILHPEDHAISRSYRAWLEEEHGLVFAPLEIASRFSFEHVPPNGPTFGFHGPANMARAYRDESIARFDFLFG